MVLVIYQTVKLARCDEISSFQRISSRNKIQWLERRSGCEVWKLQLGPSHTPQALINYTFWHMLKALGIHSGLGVWEQWEPRSMILLENLVTKHVKIWDNFLARQFFPRQEIKWCGNVRLDHTRQRHHNHPARRSRSTQLKDRRTGREREVGEYFFWNSTEPERDLLSLSLSSSCNF